MNIQATSAPQDPSFAPEDESARRSQEAGFQLIDLVRIVFVRWQLIAATAAIVLAVTLIILFQLTPLYSAKSVVMLDQQKNNVAELSAVLSGLPTDPTSMQNQVQILTSRGLAGRVIDRLHLEQDPELNPAVSGWSSLFSSILPASWFHHASSAKPTAEQIADEKNRIIDRFRNFLSVSPIELSTAINVGFESPDPAQAARITNAVADEYVEDQLNAKFEATQRATQWLSDRIQKLAQQVQGAEAAVQQYKAENNIAETADGMSIVDQQMGSVNGQLVLAKSDLAQKEANYGRVSSLVNSGRSSDVSQVVTSPLIATMRGQETDLGKQEADLLTQYGPRHPKILEIESEKQNLESKINEEVQRVVQTVANDVAVARANVGSLQASLTQLESHSQDQSKASVKLKALESAASSSRSMYEAYLGRLKETQGQEGIQTPDARVISVAEQPRAPSFPDKTLILAIAVPAGLLLGFIIALSLEQLDSGFRTSARVESTLGLPVLGTIPEIAGAGRNKAVNAADQIIDKPMSSFAEAIRGLQLGLSLSNVDAEPKVIIVSSSVPGEGKTTIAISLARQAARGGKKVVIIDGDLRRPNVAKQLGITDVTLDLCDLLAGKANLAQCLIKDPRSDAYVIPCIRTPPSPADILLSHAMEKLVTELRASCDLVIIDSAPLLPVNDTKILSRLADSILFVTRWEKTPREAARTAVRALEDIRAPIAGIALARADATRFQYYNYGYQSYYSYAKYYQ
jgi:succinoglycan biosynthesis transport protein ExoP